MSDAEFTFTLTVYAFHLLLRELEFNASIVGRHDPKPAEDLYNILAHQANRQKEGRKE